MFLKVYLTVFQFLSVICNISSQNAEKIQILVVEESSKTFDLMITKITNNFNPLIHYQTSRYKKSNIPFKNLPRFTNKNDNTLGVKNKSAIYLVGKYFGR